jgi:integrase
MRFTYETRTTKSGKVTYSKTVNLGADPETGKRRQTRITADTVSDLKRQWLEAIGQKQSGTLTAASRRPLSEYLAYWLDTYARGACKPTTYDRYAQTIRAHINPSIGHIRLDKLKPTDLAALYRQKLDTGRLDGKPGGLSPRSVRYIHATLHEALGHAVRWELLARNVADAVDAPRQERKEMRTWDADQVERFRDAARASRYAAVFDLAILTGLRRGELLGLRWQDIDLDASILTVRQALIERGAAVSFSTTKTHRSRRPVELSAMAVAVLRAHRVDQLEERLAAGAAWESSDLVFTTDVGTPVHPRNLFRAFKQTIARANAGAGVEERLPDIRIHDLRHTHATLLFRSGAHPKIVSERLGHATIGLTLDTYSHVLPGMQREAVDKLDAMLTPRRKAS